MTLVDVAQVTAALASAVAAGAAWRAATVSSQQLRRAREPHLIAEAVNEDGLVHVVVHNAGGGVALKAFCAVVSEGRAAMQELGIIEPSQQVRVRTSIPYPWPQDSARRTKLAHRDQWGLVVSCRYADGQVWAWRWGGLWPKEFPRYRGTKGDVDTTDKHIVKEMLLGFNWDKAEYCDCWLRSEDGGFPGEPTNR